MESDALATLFPTISSPSTDLGLAIFISSNAMQSENCRRWLFSIFNCASSIVVVHTHSDLDDDTNSCTQGSDVNFIHIGLGWQLNFPKNGEPMGSTNVTLNSGPKH
jgi:hypothetical protein